MVFKKVKTGKYVVPIQTDVPANTIGRTAKSEKCNKIALWLISILGLFFSILLVSVLSAQTLLVKHVLFWRIENRSSSIYENDGNVVSCYYNTPNPRNDSQLTPSNIHPHLCTHINIAFAQIRNNQIYLEDSQLDVIPDIVKLKTYNPNLKVLLSVGGAGNNDGFSKMVVNHASRKVFIKSIKYMLRNYSLDGIDLDWEFPAVKVYQNSLRKRERQHFSQLLREIRTEYIREKRNYLLTVAVAAPQIIVDAAYDVDQINMYVDYANIMTYDFHTYTKFTPFTGLNSPLYARPEEQLYFATLNINYTVQMYKDKGLDPRKIVVGIPTYGHTFALVNANNAKVGSPASGFGTLGNLGFVNYPDICMFLSKFNDTIIKQDLDAKVPFLYKESEWVSYENADSVVAKAKYITENKLRGAMIYSLNADDYDGTCDKLSGSVKFPLSTTVRNTLNQNPTSEMN
ncbi:chitinase-3-like protein 1 [Vanessa cardui]|uniref:chitinase-3-like protein 1 n=1 Tax=Vanessa cardui TaxID=171605 RepID=UPI001F12B916|nr:chitinase-3-like protein 1 [Vanessa cardui]